MRPTFVAVIALLAAGAAAEAWVRTTPFAVEGVAAGRVTPGEIRLMLQTLLEDRFALKIRRTTEESETNNVLGLVVDRSDGLLGPKP